MLLGIRSFLTSVCHPHFTLLRVMYTHKNIPHTLHVIPGAPSGPQKGPLNKHKQNFGLQEWEVVVTLSNPPLSRECTRECGTWHFTPFSPETLEQFVSSIFLTWLTNTWRYYQSFIYIHTGFQVKYLSVFWELFLASFWGQKKSALRT